MKLAALFSDHAVLQRGISVPVWGQTKPITSVVVRVGPHSAQMLSGADGRFCVRLPPMPAGGPYELEVSAPEHGEKTVVRDIWIGEVWLASGQSNMEFNFAQLGQDQSDEARETIPGVRMANVARVSRAGRQGDVEAMWQVAGDGATATFSAVAFHFARRIHEATGVTVGIINSSWGGTIIEAWTSRETLVRNPEVAAWLERYEANVHSCAFWKEDQSKASPFPRDPGNDGVTRGWAATGFDDSEWRTMAVPNTWTSQGHRHSGIFWFRRTVEIPAGWAGKELELGLGAADKQDITYFAGEQIGATGSGLEEHHWNEQRTYSIPAHLVKAGKVAIASRVYSFAFDGGLIGPAGRMKLWVKGEPEKSIALAGDWKFEIEHNFGVVVPPAAIPGPGNPNSPYILYDNMIAPVAPYAIRGAIWYQGESNAGEPQKYRRLMQDLIGDWRHAWGQGDFPFYLVQLANFITANNWPALREAQFEALATPNTGMAVTIDIGDPVNIHPANKRDVGLRLARWALAGPYGRSVVPSGPLYDGMTMEPGGIRIRFRHAAGLNAPGGKPATFVIAGGDRQFVAAEAVIEGETVLVSSPRVPSPMAVRYAWDNNPVEANLQNGEGLPASPFRTDRWPL